MELNIYERFVLLAKEGKYHEAQELINLVKETKPHLRKETVSHFKHYFTIRKEKS